MKIKIIKNKQKSNYESWSIWECEPSIFDWTYEQHRFFVNFLMNGKLSLV